MISDLIEKAERGEPVYISSVHERFQGLKENENLTLHCMLNLIETGGRRYFPIKVPQLSEIEVENKFIREYIWAEIYNILSGLGGRSMDIFIDRDSEPLKKLAREISEVFGTELTRSERRGYGRCINVIDRMLDTLDPDSGGFKFNIAGMEEMGPLPKAAEIEKGSLDLYEKVTRNLQGRTICGIDVGGTDIKIVLVRDGEIICYKEYDWFPARFKRSRQLADPVCLIVRLMRARASIEAIPEPEKRIAAERKMAAALDISASDAFMEETCETVEKLLENRTAKIDGVGMCFPDVVVRNKIVGGEVYKTRGIRNNPDIDYEQDFLELTHLNDRIRKLIGKNGKVLIINDGPMASFTAAVETAASESPAAIENGVFAHTLGTELGTGWITEEGIIPDIPLEVYNYIIDLGSYAEREYEPDDLRSINNFNTELAGTLQKYASQSGVFRLALKYFPEYRSDLFRELQELGFIEKKVTGGKTGYYVPTESRDMRKPFLEHMMMLVERENDEVNNRIWNEIGEFLAVTWIETKKILNPLTDSRVLFGRLVKRKKCFELICEGAKRIVADLHFEAADSTMANTTLMRQLEEDPHYTVAQFAQAVGAAYFVNR